MKFRTMRMLVVLVAVFCFGITEIAVAQNAATGRKAAMEGDTVWVVVNHVKPDKKEQFERFIYEIFWPSAKKLGKDVQETFNYTRVLNPAQPEEDGTYTYIFLMDPVISGADYSIQNLLEQQYPAEKAKEYYSMFEESLAREGEIYTVLQSKYWGAPRKK